jgi:hypothetical protein
MENETVVQMYLVMTSAQFESTNRWLNHDERKKLTGCICSFCETPLPHGAARGQSYCAHCPPAGAHRIRMEFCFLRRRWQCEFWDAEAGKMLPARLCFQYADSLYTLARRGRGFIGAGSGAKRNFFNAMGAGRGAINLTLNEPQYQALRAKCQTQTVPTSTLIGSNS